MAGFWASGMNCSTGIWYPGLWGGPRRRQALTTPVEVPPSYWPRKGPSRAFRAPAQEGAALEKHTGVVREADYAKKGMAAPMKART